MNRPADYTPAARSGSHVNTSPPVAPPAHHYAAYVRAVRRRAWLVGTVVLVALGIALALLLSATKLYTATARLYLNQANPVEQIIEGQSSQDVSNPERDLNSRVKLITTEPVAQAVVDELGLPLGADDLLAKVSAELEGTSDIVSVTVEDPDPVVAADIANAMVESYVTIRQQAARQAILEAAALARTQLEQLSAGQAAGEEGRSLRQRAQQLEIAAALRTGNAEIASRAEPSGSPSSPRPLLTLFAAGFLGLVLGLGLAVGLEFVDRRIKEESDLEPYGRSLLGSVPRTTETGPPETSDFVLREAYLTLATNLRFFNLGSQVETLAITSPAPREGKTSVSLGCASALAGIGLRVILLECDLRRPTVAQYTGAQSGGGLSTVLAGVSTLDESLVELDASSWHQLGERDLRGRPHFSVLPAGPIPPNPQALLSSSEMSAVVAQARAMSDVVLLDTAPVGTVNDVVTLAELVNGIVLVVRLEQTRRDVLQRALRTLDNLATPVLGFVATAGRRATSTYYGYESYQSDSADTPAAARR